MGAVPVAHGGRRELVAQATDDLRLPGDGLLGEVLQRGGLARSMKPSQVFWWGVGASAVAALLFRAREVVRERQVLPEADAGGHEGTPPGDPLIGFQGEPARPFALTQAALLQAGGDGRPAGRR